MKCARGEEDIPGMGAEGSSLSQLAALCCCLNLKMNRCSVALGEFWSKSGQLPREACIKKHMHTQICMLTHNTPWSIHYFYSMFYLSQF